jgi:hypothetical protein
MQELALLMTAGQGPGRRSSPGWWLAKAATAGLNIVLRHDARA